MRPSLGAMREPESPPRDATGLGVHLSLDLMLLELCEVAADTDSRGLSYLVTLLAAMRTLLHEAAGPKAIEEALGFVQRLALEHGESGSRRDSPAAAAADAGVPLHLRLLGLYVDPVTGSLRSAVGPPAKARMVH